MRSFKIVSFSAPASLIREIQAVAKKERRTISELLRECFRQYSSTQRLRGLNQKGRKSAKSRKLSRKEIGYEVE